MSHGRKPRQRGVINANPIGRAIANVTKLSNAERETVMAPLRVAASTWPDEAVKWGHLRNIEVQPIVGNAKARAAAQDTQAEGLSAAARQGRAGCLPCRQSGWG